jgi:hypothetical protein
MSKHRIVKGAIPMTTYWTRVRVRAWTDTLRDCGFRDVRTSVVKIIWIIIGLVIAYSTPEAASEAGRRFDLKVYADVMRLSPRQGGSAHLNLE